MYLYLACNFCIWPLSCFIVCSVQFMFGFAISLLWCINFLYLFPANETLSSVELLFLMILRTRIRFRYRSTYDRVNAVTVFV